MCLEALFTNMGMGAYDEDEQNRRENFGEEDEEDDAEVLTLGESRQNGEVKSETPETVDEMMDNWADDD